MTKALLTTLALGGLASLVPPWEQQDHGLLYTAKHSLRVYISEYPFKRR